MIRTQRNQGAPLLVLDGGNTIFSTRDDIGNWSEGRITIAAMNLMGYDALALGIKDLRGGVDLLTARIEEADFAVLSANVLLDGEPVAEPYAFFEREGISVAVLGLTAQGPDIDARFVVSDPLEAARQYVPQLEEQADVVIVLSNLGTDIQDDLLAAAKGADLIVNGGYSGPSRTVLGEYTPGLVRAGGLGEYLGLTELRLDDDNRAIAYGHQSLTLGPDYTDDAEMVRLRQQYMDEYGG